MIVRTVAVTSKGQITIPADLRRELGIVEGATLIVTRKGRALEIIPVPKISELAGVDKELFRGRRPSREIESLRREWTEEFESRAGV